MSREQPERVTKKRNSPKEGDKKQEQPGRGSE